MTWYVYLIRTRNNTLYCGVTTDIERRFTEHQSNSSRTAKYLRGKQPLSLAWQYEAIDKRQAMILESQIKRLTKQQKEQLCNMDDVLPKYLLARSVYGKKSSCI